MRKAKTRIGIVILILSILVLFLLMRNGGTDFNDCIVSSLEFESIMESRKESNSSLITDVVFNEEKLFYDHTDATYYYSIVEDDELAYDPIVKVLSQEKNIRIAIKEKSINRELISKNEMIELVAYTDSSYSIYHLRCTTLPLMNIDCEEEITEENAVMSMRLFDNRVGSVQREIWSDGLIHVRGGSTKSFPKLGYKISLTTDSLGGNRRENKRSLLGMRQDDDWILYAAYNDQEKIRNVFSSNLWMDTCGGNNSFGLENGMRYEYIELFFNGEYWGLYALGYPIDDLQLKINDNSKECIYKKILWTSEYPITYTPEGEIGGYRIVSKGKKDWSLLYDFYEKLNDEQTDNEWYYSSVDIQNAVDYSLFVNLIQGIDNVGNNLTKNMYLTAVECKDGTYKFLYTPWDMDITWGNDWGSDAHNLTMPYSLDATYNLPMESGSLYMLLINHDSYAWEALTGRYWELRSDLWSEENLSRILGEYESQIFDSGAYLRDRSRWPEGSYENPECKLSVFKEYLFERLKELDLYYDRLEKVKNENKYIIRTAQYKYFESSEFMIQLNDTYQEDEDFVELLEYIGIEKDTIPRGTKFIFYSKPEKRVEYIKSLNSADRKEWFTDNDINDNCAKVVFESSEDNRLNTLWMED